MSGSADVQARIRCAVVGAGVVGLSVSHQLLEQLHAAGAAVELTVIADSFYEQTTSYGCGGFWEPYQVGGTSQDLIVRWGSFTYRHFLQLHFSEHASAAGVQIYPAFFLYEEREMPYENPCWHNCVFNFKDLSSDDLAMLSVPPKYVGGYTFTTVAAEQKYYMKWLTSQLLKRNASFVEAEVYSLAELANTGKYDVIVNCTGLGAEKLLHTENDVYPVRGQVLRVKAPWMKAFWNFGLSYVIPNVDTVVLGGTAQVGDYNTGLSEEDTQMILDRVCELFPAIRDAPVERVWAGLRPCRKQGIRLESFLIRKTTARALCDVVRNEAESSELALSAVILAHCYGHGGCGVTLGMGCANDLVLNHIMPQLRELSLLM